jgi:hypothetical protein
LADHNSLLAIIAGVPTDAFAQTAPTTSQIRDGQRVVINFGIDNVTDKLPPSPNNPSLFNTLPDTYPDTYPDTAAIA